MGLRHWLKGCWLYRSLWLSILVPLLLAPLPYYHPNSVARAGYCVIVIAFFWMTEILPLAVTSLFPVFLFPMFGIMSAKDVCSSYVKDTLMLFLGSLVVAVAVERWNLHKRLALRTLTLVGTQPRWLMLGIMLPCWFLSMWMSNTATCAMMMPIVTAILTQIRNTRRAQRRAARATSSLMKHGDSGRQEENGDIELEATRRAEDDEAAEDKEFDSLAKVFILCTAYSANIGGIATLTGTPSNIIFKGLADGLYQEHGGTNPINFASWLLIGMPVSFILFLCLWGWMQLYGEGLRCFRCVTKDSSFDSVKEALWAEYRKMGSMTFAEGVVLVNFITLALLWVTRSPGFIPGWGLLFEKGFVKDSTPAVLIACVLFVLPSRAPHCLLSCRGKSAGRADESLALAASHLPYQPILTWKAVNEKLAWGVLLLMGGGFALADGCQASGLSQWMSGHLEGVAQLSPWLIALILSTFIALATEMTSNAATTTLFVPIAGDLAVKLGVHPLMFMVPCTVATSLAFLLPVATPPNAIVFASGYLRVKDMVLGGIPMNIISLVVLNVAINTYIVSAFDLSQLPDLFKVNASSSLSSSSSPLEYLAGTTSGGLVLNVTGSP
ncbi:Na(+)/citrate cotransporter-like isoform X2 [Babylonia areolata]|uniref:Na(+)/citrate cotransporter-like isoform X2 n=1 Tax=Babylonia areolata TaxID=304850 RepID=UPI003FD6659A